MELNFRFGSRSIFGAVPRLRSLIPGCGSLLGYPLKKTFGLLAFCVIVLSGAANIARAGPYLDGARQGDTIAVGAEQSAKQDRIPFEFRGFGTLGVSHASQRLGDYIVDSTVPKGAGRSHDWSMGNDSRIGLQADLNLSARTSAVVQVISEYQADETYWPTIEWANLKYALAPKVFIRLGRIALPTFLNSDSRKVGYSYPWIHPPLELYRQLAITNSDGADVMYHFTIGDAENSVKALVGTNKIERPTSTSYSREMWGIFDTLEYAQTTLHFSYQQREARSDNHVTGVTGPWIQNSDYSVGVTYDTGSWFATSEWVRRESTTRVDAAYLSTGNRFHSFTPYLTYSKNRPASFLPGFPAPTPAAIQSAKRSQSTVSLGLRWDFMKNTDIKLQFDQIRLSGDSNGYLANVPAGITLYGAKFYVVSALVDFVF